MPAPLAASGEGRRQEKSSMRNLLASATAEPENKRQDGITVKAHRKNTKNCAAGKKLIRLHAGKMRSHTPDVHSP